MATQIKIVREVVDHEPNSSNPVTVEQAGDEAAIALEQDSDRIHMSLEHARAVHSALGSLIADIDAA